MKKNTKDSDGREDIQGFKYFKVLAKLTEHLHEAYLDPKHPNKRVLHYDQHMGLLADRTRKKKPVTGPLFYMGPN
jgi:hypothetical protein